MANSIKIKAAGWGAKAAFKTTNNSGNFISSNAKAQCGIARDELPTPFFYYKKIFPKIMRGSKWVKVCCVFHNDRNPSLSINLESGGFNCFSCSVKGGDVIAFHQQHFKLGFKESILQLKAIKKGEPK